MSTIRLLAYGALGMITGLLLENKVLKMKRKAACRKLELEKAAN